MHLLAMKIMEASNRWPARPVPQNQIINTRHTINWLLVWWRWRQWDTPMLLALTVFIVLGTKGNGTR